MTSAVRSRMTHRTTIERSAHDDTDRYAVPAFEEIDSGGEPVLYPCFLWTKSGREAVDPERTAVVESVRVLMPTGTDVKPTDRLGDITNRLGAVILAGVFDVESVLPHHDHIELDVRRVTGGT